MTNTLPVLLAAPGWNEIFSVFVAIVFFVVWLVNQISDAKKQQKNRDQAQAEPLLVDGDANAAPVPKPDPLRAQVDEFLRRAGKEPGGQGPPQTPPQRKPPAREEIVVLLDDSVAEPARQAPIERKQLPSAMPGAREKRSAAPPRQSQTSSPKRPAVKPRPKSVAEHVAQHSGAASQQFREEVADLGERVKQADEQFDRQLQRRFDHELGSLRGKVASVAPIAQSVAATPASDIAAMLASPAGVRQAIVINEILRRPTDQW